MPLRLPLALAVVLLSGCKTAGYLNEAYPFAQRPAPFTVAVAPAVAEGPLALHTDSVAAQLFAREGYTYGLVPPADLRTRMGADPALFSTLARLASHRYSEAELASGPGLAAALSPEEATRLRTALGADFLLLPIEFSLGGALGQTGGRATYRLYDLQRGDLIYEYPRPLNLNVPGEPGAILLSIGLIGASAQHFEEVFLRR